MPARPVKVLDVRPLHDAEPRHLGGAAGDEAGARVVAEAETVRHAHRHGDGVLDGAAELDAQDVVVRVHPERVARDGVLQLDRDLVVVSRDHGRRRHVAAHLFGVVGTGERRGRRTCLLGDDLRRTLERAELVALGQRELQAPARRRGATQRATSRTACVGTA